MRKFVLLSTAAILAAVSLAGADWPQWRGPGRDGIAPAGPKLLDKWPKAGPLKLWDTEKLPAGGSAGYSCPVVVDGKVYTFVNRRYNVPFDERILTSGRLRSLGWHATKPPAELLKKIEDARVSEERAKQKGGAYNKWRDAWIKKNLTPEEIKKHNRFAHDRLNRGKKAPDLATLDKLEPLRDKKLANQAELDKWFADNGIDEKLKKTALRVIPTSKPEGDDLFACFNAADGKTLWKFNKLGKPHGWGVSGTICIADGRAYCVGTTGELYCVDAEKGDVLWKVPASKGGVHTSAMVLDGKIIVLAKTVAAFDVKDGKELWRTKIRGTDPSPDVWKSGEKTYIITYTGSSAVCIDPADGKQLWSVKVGGGQSSAVVVGDKLVIQTNDKKVGLVALKLSAEKAEKLWNATDFVDGSASPVVHGGHVYIVIKDRAACLTLADGSVKWTGKVKGSVGWGSPVLVDGKLITILGGGKVLLHKLDPEKYEQLGVAALGGLNWSSAAVVAGKLYIRTKDTIACYDLTKPAEEKAKPGK